MFCFIFVINFFGLRLYLLHSRSVKNQLALELNISLFVFALIQNNSDHFKSLQKKILKIDPNVLSQSQLFRELIS